MESGKNRIIVFQAFDTLIQANLVKTKLDAYGIPCFLSDENFVNLYPIRNDIFPGIRLHIFENDAARVTEILSENLANEKGDGVKCPVCQSTRISLANSRKGWAAWLLASLLFTVLPQKRVFRCQTCDAEFDYAQS